MHPLDFIEKFSALASGAFSSWPSISTNIIVLIVFFFAHNLLEQCYAKLEGMNNTFLNIATLLLAFTLYGITYRAVSTISSFISQHSEVKRKKLEAIQHKENIKQVLRNLSCQEIAVLKFILKQECHSAWLPDEDTSVILLEHKNIIHNIDLIRTKIVNFWHGSNRNLSCNLYQITDDAQKLLIEMHKELSKKWRNVKTKNTFADFQKL